MKFSICIPATRASAVGYAIRSVQQQTVTDWELIVIGQGAADEVLAVVNAASQEDRRVRSVHISGRGASRARNAGMLAARGDIVALLDDDCEAAPDWLAVFARCLEERPDVGLVGGALIAPAPAHRGFGNCPNMVPADAVYEPVEAGRVAPAGWDWLSANVAFRRPLIEQVGLFDEWLGPGTEFASCDDTDLKLRFERAGIRMWATPQARVLHRFGWRYGLRAVLALQRSYARGNGAMAGKLTLMGDRRGREWWQAMRDDCLARWYRRREPMQLPAGLRRWHYFNSGYQRCLSAFQVDERGLLVPRPTPAGEPALSAVG